MSFEKVLIDLPRLIMDARDAGKTLQGRRFVDCVIRGPAILIPYGDTQFVRSNLGDVVGDVRNLFLRASGPMIIGATAIQGCIFEGCLFVDVGFAGTAQFIEDFISHLPSKA